MKPETPDGENASKRLVVCVRCWRAVESNNLSIEAFGGPCEVAVKEQWDAFFDVPNHPADDEAAFARLGRISAALMSPSGGHLTKGYTEGNPKPTYNGEPLAKAYYAFTVDTPQAEFEQGVRTLLEATE